MGNARLILPLALAFTLATAAPSAAAPGGGDDRFLAGVATAVLELEFGLTDLDLVVENGRLRLDPAQLGGHDPEVVRARLDALRGLEVTLEQNGPVAGLRMVADTTTLPPPVRPASAPASPRVTGFLPDRQVFESPLADPRSPATGVTYQRYFQNGELTNVGRAEIGGSLPVYGWQAGGALMQVGVQAGVFSIFDLERPSMELINADYLVAVPLEARHGDLSGRVRILHQSSHLGDEYLLRTGADRVNLSYEALDFLLGYDLTDQFRLYGGGSTLLRKRPRDLERLGAQAGIEFRGREPILSPLIRPVAGLDLQAFQETDWDPSFSARGGIEIGNGFLHGTRVQLLGEYFNGRSPNGQFFERTVEYAGVGLRILF
jgi:hypothetical protein